MIDNKTKDKILVELNNMFPDAKGELDHENDFELLVAVVLSAQTTDIAVNIVTKDLFKHYPTPEKLANANVDHVMELINRIGLYRNKSKNIIALSKILVDKHNSKVPNSREELEALPGVGRKTANVILANAFNIPAIAVDTHVNRVSKRLGIAPEKASLLQVEKSIMDTFPSNTWNKLHHQLIFFGRYHCKSRNPECEKCPLYDICTYLDKNQFKFKKI